MYYNIYNNATDITYIKSICFYYSYVITWFSEVHSFFHSLGKPLLSAHCIPGSGPYPLWLAKPTYWVCP